jgi:hypothetical protein
MTSNTPEFISLKPSISGLSQNKSPPAREIIRTPSPTPSENTVLTGEKRKRNIKWNFRTIGMSKDV